MTYKECYEMLKFKALLNNFVEKMLDNPFLNAYTVSIKKRIRQNVKPKHESKSYQAITKVVKR